MLCPTLLQHLSQLNLGFENSQSFSHFCCTWFDFNLSLNRRPNTEGKRGKAPRPRLRSAWLHRPEERIVPLCSKGCQGRGSRKDAAQPEPPELTAAECKWRRAGTPRGPLFPARANRPDLMRTRTQGQQAPHQAAGSSSPGCLVASSVGFQPSSLMPSESTKEPSSGALPTPPSPKFLMKEQLPDSPQHRTPQIQDLQGSGGARKGAAEAAVVSGGEG